MGFISLFEKHTSAFWSEKKFIYINLQMMFLNLTDEQKNKMQEFK